MTKKRKFRSLLTIFFAVLFSTILFSTATALEHEHSYTNPCDADCNVCGAIRLVNHTYDNYCDTSCNICGATRPVSHTYSNSCDTTCNVCGATRTVSHNYVQTETGTLLDASTCPDKKHYGGYKCSCGAWSGATWTSWEFVGHAWGAWYYVSYWDGVTYVEYHRRDCARCGAYETTRRFL